MIAGERLPVPYVFKNETLLDRLQMTYCIITMVKDEWHFFPIWKKYYGQFFKDSAIFIINDNSSLDFVEKNFTNENIINLPDHHINDIKTKDRNKMKNTFDGRRALLISSLARGLLNYFETVIYTDVDEIIVPDPQKHTDLATYLEGTDEPQIVAPVGINVVHVPSKEIHPIDLTKPILSQRVYGYISGSYTKPSIIRKPTRWSPGFHGCRSRFIWDENLIMFHLRDIDVDLRHKNHLTRFNTSSEWGRSVEAWKNTPDTVRKNYISRVKQSTQVQQQIRQVIEFTCDDFWNCHNIRRFKQALRRPGLRRGTVAPAWFEWFR